MLLQGKVALVSGAAQGLGKAFTEAILARGGKVSLVDINPTVGQAAKSELDSQFGADKSIFLQCDVTSATELQDAFNKTKSHFGAIDIVINNAGINNEAEWEKTFNINLVAVVRSTYLALEMLSKGGVVINIASMAGLGVIPYAPVYCASKHGVVGFSRAIAGACELQGRGVRVCCVCPTYVDTPLLSTVGRADTMGQFEDLREGLVKTLMDTPIMQPCSVVEGVIRLLEDDSLNGTVMSVTPKKGAHVHAFPSSLL
ncbi:15-hydroxyprostaglandin dehydrogenase [NAD(+)] isoform X2 [Petromyzon marinus]|uniref:15-hydroxyprostaglandin dehydrogenase [NAD(+)] isoform X2 n=1 Tax=Petromyzon marinus TaxID=7757 RepID=UPI003F703488